MKDDVYYKDFYDKIWYPNDSKTHSKVAITKRDQWMIDHADLLIEHIENDCKSGALITLKHAGKKVIQIINLAIGNK
ncbi:MAG: hypothetical protein J6S14_18790 [Clostridia bacterium]|nr:hypothetical protein [Clostridia bacterium]